MASTDEITNTSPLTRSIAEFASSPIDWETIPAASMAMARNATLDTSAVMIAGFEQPSVQILRQHVRKSYAPASEASIVFELGGRASAKAAALVNAVAAHALDYDDVAFKAHPSAVLVPALFAEAERIAATGKRFIMAYLVGFEVWAELASRDRDPYHKKGWHPTAALGAVAATAALGFLSEDDIDTISNALGIAAAHAGGLTGNFGTMAKHLQVGRAAATAVDALSLARMGMTGAHDILEHRGGLLSALSPLGQTDLTGGRFVNDFRWSIETPLDFKRYPVCYGTHRVIDGIFRMMAEHHLVADQVADVSIRLRPTQAAILRSHCPDNGLDARFSIEFAIAAPLVFGKVGLAELQDHFVQDPLVQEIMRKTSVTTGVDGTHEAETDRFSVTLKNGKVLDSGELPKATSNDDLRSKFFDCCATNREIDAKQLYSAVMGLAELDDVRALSKHAISAV